MKQKTKIEYKRALIYCRVSSVRQVVDGDGLNSQEHRCHQKAQELGLEVARVFHDPAISGGLLERPAMAKLISFLDEHPNEKFVVIFDDIKRFARKVDVHLTLKSELSFKRHARLVCLNFNFEDSPTGNFIEVVMAAGAQLEREQNREQVINKMKARLESGFWTFCPPPGLTNANLSAKGRVLISNEPFARIYKEAIEMFRDYKLNTLESTKDFILAQYAKYGIKRPLSISGTKNILANVLYAGYLEYKPWGVPLMKGKHEGFISYETHLAVLDILKNKSRPRLRKDYNSDFPVRGYALCSHCHKPMTAGWFKGNGRDKKPYYLCKTTLCPRKNHVVHREALEVSFRTLLEQAKPHKKAMDLINAVLIDVWNNRAEQESKLKSSIEVSITAVEAKNDALMGRIVQTSNDGLVGQYEQAISQNLLEIKKLKEKIAKIKYSPDGFQTALKEVLDFVGSPIKQWESKDYKRQRLLLNMYFDSKLVYHPEFGFQTVELPLILELSGKKTLIKVNLVDTLQNSLNPIIEWVMRSYGLLQTLEDISI